MKKSKKLIILLSLVIVVICSAVFVLMMVTDKSSDTQIYTDKINKGIEYYNNGNYEEAIKVFEDVIKEDPKNEQAYKNLGYAYLNTDRKNMAYSLWNSAYAETGNDEFLKLVSTYFGDSKVDDNNSLGGETEITKKVTDKKSINAEFMTKLAEFTFSKYVAQYGSATVKNDHGIAIVTHPRFKGKFEYGVDPKGNKKIGSNGKPLDGAVPDAIIMDDISELFRDVDDVITFDDLSTLGVVGLKRQDEGSSHKVIFKYKGCTFNVNCDENGTINLKDSANRIVPEQKISEEGAKRNFSVDIVLASTGKHVEGNYRFDIAKAEDVKSGKNSVLGAADNVFFSTTVTNGVVDIALANGKYVVCVYPENDPSNFKRYNWEIKDTTRDADLKIVVTKKLANGQIIIVLKWGATPRDLDSHVVGNGSHISFRNRSTPIGNLDVDCMRGNGIETITLKNGNGTYRYYVDNYSNEEAMGLHSNATVEVFTEGSSSPRVFTIPNTMRKIWKVFEIRNGELVVINQEATAIN